jgi:radical SAM-linked protein
LVLEFRLKPVSKHRLKPELQHPNAATGRTPVPRQMGIPDAMASDTPQAAVTASVADGTHPVRDKVRIRFRKGDDLRLLSHHDLMRAFQRMLRRAALPVQQSQGFHPQPRLIFALSLPLGVIGCEEVVEIELDQMLPLDELRERLVRQAPQGLEILSIRRIGVRDGAQVRRLTYRLAVPAEHVAGVAERIAVVLASPECWVERTRPPVRRVDLRSFLSDLRLIELSPNTFALEMELFLTPHGTARPEEVLTVLGLQDLIEAGAILERSRLELEDEFVHQITAEGIA